MNLLKQFRKLGVVVAIASAVTFIAPSVMPANATMATVSAATVKLNKKKLNLVTGESKKLKVTGSSEKVKWSSDNKEVAKVSKAGKVTAVSTGVATITAKVGSKKLTCEVTVSAFEGVIQTFESGAGYLVPEGWYVLDIPAIGGEIDMIAESEQSQSFIQLTEIPYGEVTTEEFIAYIKDAASSEKVEVAVETYIQTFSGVALDFTTEFFGQEECTISDHAAICTYSALFYDGLACCEVYCYDIYDGANVYEILCYNFLESDVNFVDYVDYIAQNIAYIQ